MWTGTSTVTFSPRATISKSTCSRNPLSGSRCTAFGSASSAPPGRPSRRISTFGVLSASISSWPGSARCRGSVPWPYRTAGTLPARRVRRAGPLPNSLRGSAAMRTSGTVVAPQADALLRQDSSGCGIPASRSLRSLAENRWLTRIWAVSGSGTATSACSRRGEGQAPPHDRHGASGAAELDLLRRFSGLRYFEPDLGERYSCEGSGEAVPSLPPCTVSWDGAGFSLVGGTGSLVSLSAMIVLSCPDPREPGRT